MRDLAYEAFVWLFLGTRHCILRDEDLFRGTLGGASVYPREVVNRARSMSLR